MWFRYDFRVQLITLTFDNNFNKDTSTATLRFGQDSQRRRAMKEVEITDKIADLVQPTMKGYHTYELVVCNGCKVRLLLLLLLYSIHA